jgi:hypothetical protein
MLMKIWNTRILKVLYEIFYTIFNIIYNSNRINLSSYHLINLKNLKIFIIHPVTNTLNMVMFTSVSNHHIFRFLCFFNIATHNLKSFSMSMAIKLRTAKDFKEIYYFYGTA